MSKYKLVEKTSGYTDTFKVTIVADSNDADYVTSINYYSKESFDEYVIDGLIDLQENASGSHELENYNNKFDLEIPYNGWDGYCHSLEDLIVEYIDKDGKIWDVEFGEYVEGELIDDTFNDATYFIIYVNEEFEEEKALVNLVTDEVVLKGDYYHDKIDHKIEGYLIALGIDIDEVEEEYINSEAPEHKELEFYER